MIQVNQTLSIPKDLELENRSVAQYNQNETDVDNLTIPEEKTGTKRHPDAFPSINSQVK